MPCATGDTGLGMQKHLGLVKRLTQTCEAWGYFKGTGVISCGIVGFILKSGAGATSLDKVGVI